MDLVDYYCADVFEMVPHSAAGKNCLEGFRCGYEKIWWSGYHSPSISGGSVAVAYFDSEAELSGPEL